MEPPIQDTRFPATAKQLLARVNSGELTMAEFLQECAYWSVKDGFDELKPLALPFMPPKVAEFEDMGLERIKRLDYKFYLEWPEVNKYYEKLLWVLNKNATMIAWLQEIKTYIPAEDIPVHQQINERLQDFWAQKIVTKPRLARFFEIRRENEKNPEAN